MKDTFLQIKNLCVEVVKEDSNVREILHKINLNIALGEIHVILGPNGSGKSTLMNVIMGHPKYVVTSGDILINNESVLTVPTHERAKLGLFLSFQKPQEIPGVTLENMIRTSRQALTGEKSKIIVFKKEMQNVMATMKMAPEYASRYLNVGFSGGEQKRAEILQLLMLNPKLALLDETDSGLDVDAVQIVSEGIAKFHNENNSCLIITHNIRILEKLPVDMVHVMIDGRIVQEGRRDLIEEINKDGFTKWTKGNKNVS